MIAHTGILVRDYKKSKTFYTKVLATLGYKVSMNYPKFKMMGFKEGGHTSFWFGQQKKFVPFHIAFLAKSKRAVQAFHAAALKAGAKDNGAPGFRTHYSPEYYAAFFLDRDGNNIEACYFGEKAPKAKK